MPYRRTTINGRGRKNANGVMGMKCVFQAEDFLYTKEKEEKPVILNLTVV